MSSNILDKLKADKQKLAKLSGSNAPINLCHLRSFTNGDTQQEAALFSLFHKSLDACLTWMQDNIDAKDSQWHDTLHRLKGAAANLGAEKLASLCKRAESMTSPSKREIVLQEIEAESEEVLEQIENL